MGQIRPAVMGWTVGVRKRNKTGMEIVKKREPFVKGIFPPLSSLQVAPSPLCCCFNIRHVSQPELKWDEERERKGTCGREFSFYFFSTEV